MALCNNFKLKVSLKVHFNSLCFNTKVHLFWCVDYAKAHVNYLIIIVTSVLLCIN